MGDTITKDEAKEMMEIVSTIREKGEEFGTASADFKRYSENAETRLKELDEKNEAIVAKAIEEAKAAEELKERLEALELRAAANVKVNGILDAKAANRYMNALFQRGWAEYVAKNGPEAVALLESTKTLNLREIPVLEAQKMAREIETKAATDLLRSDIGELGGFLCPPEYAAELERNIIEYGPVRRFARVKRTASKIYKQPVRIGIPQAERPGEARGGGSTVPNYVMEDWTPVRLNNTTPVTIDELIFNAYDLAGELVKDNGEAFAVKESAEFFNGTGNEQGLGFTTDPNVPEFETATTTLTFDDVINITGELKQGYNPMYSFNRRTLAYLRTLKDTADRYLWSGPFGDAAAGPGATINGLPYSAAFIEYDDFDVNAGFPILFADMPRFYLIVDRTDITVIRDEYTRKKEGIVEFTFNKWCFGQPLIKEAGIRMLRKST